MRILKKSGFVLIALLLMFALIYLLGPKHPLIPFDALPITTSYHISDLDRLIENRESQHSIKADNEARIIWHSGVQKTQYGILYLHGWSASQGEADPIQRELADKYGANLTLARLPGHGLIGEDLLLNTTAEEVVTYSKEIINIAAQTCESLIVFSCSTGSTLSVYLASGDKRIKAQLMTSPNFGILAPSFDLVSQTMNDDVFAKITTSVSIGYSNKNQERKDKIIDLSLIQPFVEAIATPREKVTTQAFSECKYHLMTTPSYYKDYHLVRQGIEHYMENSLQIKTKTDSQC